VIVKIQKGGKGLGVRIPKSLAQNASLREGTSVDPRVEDGRLVIVSAGKKYILAELVSKITPQNRHPETDWGPPVGKDAW
jgi:antitoxin MazE